MMFTALEFSAEKMMYDAATIIFHDPQSGMLGERQMTIDELKLWADAHEVSITKTEHRNQWIVTPLNDKAAVLFKITYF